MTNQFFPHLESYVNVATNYYELLDVSPNASIEEIKRAYRAKVMSCHPDRGGTHKEMVTVAEAWEVLSNEGLRAEYDRARAKPNDHAAQDKWSQKAQGARQAAAKYTQDWPNLKTHVDAVLNDVTAAEYGESRFLWTSFSTVKGSISGWIFIILGSIYGVIVVFCVADTFLPEKAMKSVGLFIFVLGTAGGARFGRFAHSFWRDTIRERANRTPIISCEKCGQKLRLPELDKAIQIRCQRCGASFIHAPDLAERVKRLEAIAKGKWKRRIAITIFVFYFFCSVLLVLGKFIPKKGPVSQREIDEAVRVLLDPKSYSGKPWPTTSPSPTP